MRLFNLHSFASAAMLAFAVSGLASAASATDWTLTKATGEVMITGVEIGAQPIAATNGTVVATGQTLTTGAGGRALLVHGKDVVSVGPATVLTVPRAASGGDMTVLVQTNGTIELDIEKLAQPHFAVETPYLTATVKGTHFTVTVSTNYASVAVTEGRVEVTDHTTADFVALLPGQSAAIDATKRGLQVTGAPPPVVQSGKGAGNNGNGNGSGSANDNTVRASLGNPGNANGNGNSNGGGSANDHAVRASLGNPGNANSNGNGGAKSASDTEATAGKNDNGNRDAGGYGNGVGNSNVVAQANTEVVHEALSSGNGNGSGGGGQGRGH